MLQVNDFLLRLSLCRGIGLVSKYRLWECAQQARCFNNIDYVKGGFELSFYGGLKMYDSGGLRIDRC
ncbi:hypothetical protein ACWAS6_04350 [Limosilactobacillus reuteri]